MIVSFPLLAALLIQSASTVLAEVTVTTLAGNGRPGHTNGQEESARFNYPLGIAIDRNGTILVTEKFRNHIRKIDITGVVSTFPKRTWLGRGLIRALCSGCHQITGIATDGDGNVYMADWGGMTIQKMNSRGQCSTLAGSGISGLVDGPAKYARFHSLLNVAVDPAGNVYVTERRSSRIRKITPDGTVMTYAMGPSPGFAEQLDHYSGYKLPLGIVMNVDGYIYLADTGRHRIRRIAPDGSIEDFAGLGVDGYRNGPADRAMFNRPMGIVAAADGTLYVTDTGNHRIRKITLDGRVSTIAGSGSYGSLDSNGPLASFHEPMGIAIDTDGNLFVTDTRNHVIRKITFSSNGESDDYDDDDLSDVDDYDTIVSPSKLRHSVTPKPINYDIDECAICYDVKTKGQQFDYCSIGCGHSFHKQCINQCMKHAAQRVCPMCRTQWVTNKPVMEIPSTGLEPLNDAISSLSVEMHVFEPNLVES